MKWPLESASHAEATSTKTTITTMSTDLRLIHLSKSTPSSEVKKFPVVKTSTMAALSADVKQEPFAKVEPAPTWARSSVARHRRRQHKHSSRRRSLCDKGSLELGKFLNKTQTLCRTPSLVPSANTHPHQHAIHLDNGAYFLHLTR